MRRIRVGIFLLLSLILIISCATTGGGLKFLEEPNPDAVMIIGNVIVENINQEFGFDNWGMSAEVIIIGKSDDGTMNHYTVNTDNKGYYCLPNLPKGQYALKVVVLPIIGERPIKLVNDLTSSQSQFYRMRHPECPIEFTAAWLPPEGKSRILNFDIIWMGLRSAYIADLSEKSVGEILVARSKEGLKGKRFYENGYPYIREEPLTYFKNKFPESGWWK